MALELTLFSAADMSGDLTSDPVHVPADKHVSAAFTWTGTPSGTLSLQCDFNDGAWADVPGADAEFSGKQPAGSAQATPIVCNWSGVPGKRWRVKFTRSSSSGALSSKAVV